MMSIDTVQLWGPLWLTIQLAGITTLTLLVVGTPLAWWLARSRLRIKPVIETVVALPLVLPPTVLGFYLLIAMGPQGLIGAPWVAISDTTLAFSFAGLVLASCIYSLPFVIQPLQNSFESIGDGPLEAAWSLGARPLDTFFSIVVPQASRGYLTAAVMGFAHTLGEFGVVLMVGGNIPGETRVISIAIYDHVETLEYSAAHLMSGVLLLFSFTVLLLVYSVNRHRGLR
jgi:molybdate transport system permease protein